MDTWRLGPGHLTGQPGRTADAGPRKARSQHQQSAPESGARNPGRDSYPSIELETGKYALPIGFFSRLLGRDDRAGHPKPRQGSYFPGFLKHRRRAERALAPVVATS